MVSSKKNAILATRKDIHQLTKTEMTTWNEAIEDFKSFLTLEKALSNNSIGAYLNDIRKLIAYCAQSQPPLSPTDITYDRLTCFLGDLNASGVSIRTQARCVSSLKAFFKYLRYDGKIEINPASLLETPKIGKSLPKVLSIEEVEALIRAVNVEKPEGQRNKAIIETLYSCGLRVSELVNLKISNTNFQLGYIKVEGKGNKERIVPLHDTAKKEILHYLENRRKNAPAKGYEDTLFLNKMGKGLSRIMIFNIIKELALRAGIHKVISPHTLRHSFASHLINGGADIRAVQNMLGHESILTTEIYTHLDNTFLRDTIINYHPRSKNAIKR